MSLSLHGAGRREPWERGCKKYGLLHQWDDSNAVRKLLCNKEGGKHPLKLLTNKSYETWDTTALCKFTFYAKSFATRDSKGDLKTLDELYIKPRGPNPSGQFHSSVISANGNIDETYALAIDQLRLLRNWRSHSTRAEMDKKTLIGLLNWLKMHLKLFQSIQTKLMPL